jgi:membrane protease YdiL (CAAX protease family)
MHQTFDLVLVSIYAVLWPAIELWRLPHVRARMERAPLGGRVVQYASTMAIEWALALAVLARLVLGHRPLALIGLALPHTVLGWVVSAAALALTLWMLHLQSLATGSERGRAAIARQLSRMGWMMPRERREFAAFSALSLTAGVCEEILFRGHLMAFFDALVGPILSTVAACALFGFGHAYQGKAGIVRTAIVGLFMALVYRATGSLLAPIISHALIDYGGGRLVERIHRFGVVLGSDPAAATPAPATPAPGAGSAA